MTRRGIRVLVESGHDQEQKLISLRHWLAAEDEFRGHVEFEETDIDVGEMGSFAEALIVAVGSGGALTVLSNSIQTWLQQQRSAVAIKMSNSNGDCVEITAEGPAADVVIAHLEE
ncbi:hypothetical protein LTV02_14585 [Nocardia yamanashiensis]|uniref:effector-associated constant component EACC1 n=1 Tax=Nocardia yamanashiensis TaxID=209247 RepID=UPI001E595AB7|nr:hypothetical protein [Nocardia yamanashiensis]UGT44537.1 hypothetical protein LTV02_14585 [Nocardia yamanashiensis]